MSDRSAGSPRNGKGFTPRSQFKNGDLSMLKTPTVNANLRSHKARHEFHIAARKRNKLIRAFETSQNKKTAPFLLTISGL